MAYHSVLVTGANRGIGYQFVVELLKTNPIHIIATCRDVSKATDLNKLASEHSNIHILQLEMTDYANYESFVSKVGKIVGEKGLQFLIQNAGLNIIEDCNPESYLKMYEVNAVSPLLLTEKLMPLLKKSALIGQRTIISFIGSLLGSIELNNDNKLIGYRMSKSALNQGVRTLSLKYKNDSIEFIILHPGHVQTDMGTRNQTVKAPVTKEESILGMLKAIENKDLCKDGHVITWEGKILPW